MVELVKIKTIQVRANTAIKDHVYINSYFVFLIALKKLKITICAKSAGIEIESASNILIFSSSAPSVSVFDMLMLTTNIAKAIIVPRKIASLKEIIKSMFISSVFKFADPAIFTSDTEKKPMATTVRKEISAHANDAWASESTM